MRSPKFQQLIAEAQRHQFVYATRAQRSPDHAIDLPLRQHVGPGVDGLAGDTKRERSAPLVAPNIDSLPFGHLRFHALMLEVFAPWRQPEDLDMRPTNMRPLEPRTNLLIARGIPVIPGFLVPGGANMVDLRGRLE